MENGDESLNRALADIEMLQAAYPDEVSVDDDKDDTAPPAFPLHCSLHLSPDSFVQLEFVRGYPTLTGLQICRYRSPHKARMDAVVCAIRQASLECLSDQVEGGFTCCAAALDAWNEHESAEITTAILEEEDEFQEEIQQSQTTPPVEWITGEALVDRKSSFVARVCRVSSERQVHEALHQLIDGNSKLQRATHNMVRVLLLGGGVGFGNAEMLYSALSLFSPTTTTPPLSYIVRI